MKSSRCSGAAISCTMAQFEKKVGPRWPPRALLVSEKMHRVGGSVPKVTTFANASSCVRGWEFPSHIAPSRRRAEEGSLPETSTKFRIAGAEQK